MEYNIEIPLYACATICVEREEGLTKEELINSITRDEMCRADVYTDSIKDTLRHMIVIKKSISDIDVTDPETADPIYEDS